MGDVLSSSNEWLKAVFEAIKIAAILIGGLFASYEYRRFRRYGAKTQLDVDFDLYPLEKPKGDYILVIRPAIKNLGNVRQILPIIETWVNTSTVNDFEKFDPDIKEELKFSKKLIPKPDISKESIDKIDLLKHVPDHYIFVDPGVQQIVPYKVVIKDPGDFIEVVVRFFYRVSWPSYMMLRILAGMGWSKRWQGQQKIDRLKKYRVDKFHQASKIKQVTITGVR